ncbi:MAG: MarR family transcriptional regulator [Opitutaceae bacterium]|jgi:DNA-binding MarR family transcriptional regulator
MQRIVLKDIPRYECLVEASRQFPDLDPSACEAFLQLIRAGDEVWSVMNSNFAQHGITQGRFLLMTLLMEKPDTDCSHPGTPAELAGQAQVSRATITGLLDTLERDGFVSREPDAGDRRQVTVRLTAAGVSFMHGFLPKHFRLMNGLMANLSESERKTLVALLAKIDTGAAVERTESTSTVD